MRSGSKAAQFVFEDLRLNRGSPPNFGDGVGLIGFLAALSNNAKAVVGEVFKAVGSALNEFHFAMEAFSNAVVFGKAPHGRQGFSPAR